MVNIKIAVFWNVNPCSLVERPQHFGGTNYPFVIDLKEDENNENVFILKNQVLKTHEYIKAKR